MGVFSRSNFAHIPLYLKQYLVEYLSLFFSITYKILYSMNCEHSIRVGAIQFDLLRKQWLPTYREVQRMFAFRMHEL